MGVESTKREVLVVSLCLTLKSPWWPRIHDDMLGNAIEISQYI